MTDMTVAKTILSQLGGSQFVALTGAKNLVASKDTLALKVGRNSKGVTHVRVRLDPSDTYTVTFLKARAGEIKTLHEVSDVYCDALRARDWPFPPRRNGQLPHLLPPFKGSTLIPLQKEQSNE